MPEGYAAFVEELPGANAQGASLEEARQNLQEAIDLTLEANRTLAEEALAGKQFGADLSTNRDMQDAFVRKFNSLCL